MDLDVLSRVYGLWVVGSDASPGSVDQAALAPIENQRLVAVAASGGTVSCHDGGSPNVAVGVLPGLDTKLIRGASFIAKLFPNAVEAHQVDRWKDQCRFALQIGRSTFHFIDHQWQCLIGSDAMVDRLLGDEVVGLFVPGMAGKGHARLAVEAARQLLELTGHREAEGPWLPVGIGVHTGPAYVGIVGGSQGEPQDFTALGDNVNITARLASLAGPGEVLISEAACEAAGLGEEPLESRQLELKGKSGPTAVRVLRVAPE